MDERVIDGESGWMRFGSLPFVAAVLVAINGLYMAFVAFGNITDFGTNQLFVQHVLSMDTTNFGADPGTSLDPDVMWRAIENETLQNIAYIALIAWEIITAILLLGSLIFWVTGRASAGYAKARALSTIGLLMLVTLFMGGFIAIGGEWFQMWKSQAWNGIDAAFRNSMLGLVTLAILHLPSSHWDVNTDP